jgi:hypothetical protein
MSGSRCCCPPPGPGGGAGGSFLPDLFMFNDFIGSNYDNYIWNIVGTGSFNHQNSIGGRVLARANTSNQIEININNMGNYSAEKHFVIEWKGKLIPSSNGSSECGMDAAGSQGSNWICWIYKPGDSTKFRCQTGSGGSITTVDSDINGDTNEHYFKIIGDSGVLQFYLDNMLKTSITTNISNSRLQPYLWMQGGGSSPSDADMDYVLAIGDR